MCSFFSTHCPSVGRCAIPSCFASSLAQHQSHATGLYFSQNFCQTSSCSWRVSRNTNPQHLSVTSNIANRELHLNHHYFVRGIRSFTLEFWSSKNSPNQPFSDQPIDDHFTTFDLLIKLPPLLTNCLLQTLPTVPIVHFFRRRQHFLYFASFCP